MPRKINWPTILDQLVLSTLTKNIGAKSRRGLTALHIEHYVFSHFRVNPKKSGATTYLRMLDSRRVKLVLESIERLKGAAKIKAGAPEYIPYVLTNALEALAEI